MGFDSEAIAYLEFLEIGLQRIRKCHLDECYSILI